MNRKRIFNFYVVWIIITFVFLIGMILLCCKFFKTCINRSYNPYPEFENEYFKYIVCGEDEYKYKEVYLLGLTDFGLQQEYLTYPEEIDGIQVYGIGYRNEGLGFYLSSYLGDFSGSKLKKMYINHAFVYSKHNIYAYDTLSGETVFWYPKIGIETDLHSCIYGYNLLKYDVYNVTDKKYTRKVANVSYQYNYEDAPNDGYYWVDSYDNSTIEFIPPEPEREDYTFAGWYKDEECTQKWDFATDKTGDEMLIEYRGQYKEYLGINLYAKWI